MLFQRLATTSAAVAATRSRLAKRALLAEAVVAAEPTEIAVVVTYLSGSLRQRRTGVGWATMSALPAPAVEATLNVLDVDLAFEQMAALGGTGSAAQRQAAVEQLFARATEPEQHLLRGLVFEEIRQGALDSLVQDALAAAFEVPVATVQRAAMFLGSSAATAVALQQGGAPALEAIGLQLGQPLRPMLASPAADVDAAVGKSQLPALVDAKLDGIRVQVHQQGEAVRIYTRSLDEITDRLPEIVESVLALGFSSLVLDGEVIGLGTDGRPLPFQVISARTASTTSVTAGRERTPLTLFAFDLLHLDGVDLLDQPLSERAEAMTNRLPASLLVPRVLVRTPEQVTEVFTEAVSNGYEGVVVKNLAAPYAAGRRSAGWIKLKPRHTFDLAVIAAEWGYGRREGKLSNLHLAARDPATGRLVMLGKTFKGLTDKILAWQTEQFPLRELRHTSTTVYIDPPFVAEIAIDGIQKSTRYPGGIALRFARVLRYREDKTVDQVDTLDSVTALAGAAEEAGDADLLDGP